MGLQIATPTMTSNTTPSGVVSVDANTSYTTPWNMFRHVQPATRKAYTTPYLGGYNLEQNAPHWVKYAFPSGEQHKILRFDFYPSSYGLPTDFRLQGSNNDSDWDDLSIRSGYTSVEDVWQEVDADSPDYYRYYRLYFEAWDFPELQFGDYLAIGGVALWEFDGQIEVPAADLGAFSAKTATGMVGEFAQVPAADLGAFSANSPSIIVGPVSKTAPSATLEFSPSAAALKILPNAAVPYTTIYRAYLDDLELPISSMQARYRSEGSSYLSIVVPDGATYADEISARSTGEIILKRGILYKTGDEQLVEIIRVDLENIRDDWGGSSRSITLDGHATYTNSVPKSIELSGASYRFSGTGKKRYRADLDLNLRPGDTATYDGDSLVVDTMVYSVSASGEQMEITEA